MTSVDWSKVEHFAFKRKTQERTFSCADGAIDITDDQPTEEGQPNRHLRIVVSGELIDDLTLFLRATRVSGIQKQKGKQVTDIEIMLAALDAIPSCSPSENFDGRFEVPLLH